VTRFGNTGWIDRSAQQGDEGDEARSRFWERPVSPQDWRAHFERLLGRFSLLAGPSSPTGGSLRGESRREALAAAGFQEAAPQADWLPLHRDQVLDLLADDYSGESLAWYEEQAEAVADFAAFFLGFIIGLAQAGGITESDRMLGEALLPGFMLEDLDRVTDADRGRSDA